MEVTHITAVQHCPLSYPCPHPSRRKRKHNYGQIRRYPVHWAPETCPWLEIQKQQRAGFTPTTVTILPSVSDPILDDDDIHEPCKGCRLGAGDQHDGPPLYQCERCNSWWHAHCLPHAPAPEQIASVPVWSCPTCPPASTANPVPLQLCTVQWAPAWQGEKHIKTLKGGKEALSRLLA